MNTPVLKAFKEKVDGQDRILNENEAVERLLRSCRGPYMVASEASEGKIELMAGCDGLFRSDPEKLYKLNTMDDIFIAARQNLSQIQKKDKLITAKVIPLTILESKILQAEAVAELDVPGNKPLFELLPYKKKTACIIAAGNTAAVNTAAGKETDSAQNSFTRAIEEKISTFGISVIKKQTVQDDLASIAAAIAGALDLKPDIIICAGGMGPENKTPEAIKQSGARIVTYGVPVFPGSLFLLGYYDHRGISVMGLPGCMYNHTAIFDFVLPRIVTGIEITKQDFAVIGNSGLRLPFKE
jgi:hypothetical protein